ncbi:uncharacterized protein [Arachis hypogaea]|uniref:uncharacterized protein n=1 Tax=Arachis hypogaea TaxID=3818 RepID=UPI000DED2087|nr:uncharacterized protein LOC112705011 [Arachis hypogaea]
MVRGGIAIDLNSGDSELDWKLDGRMYKKDQSRKWRRQGEEDQDSLWEASRETTDKKIEANRSRTYPVTWRPPPENWLKANVDAAFRKYNGTGAIAVVIKNSKGKMLLGFSGKIQAKSSTVAHAQAIRQALIIVNNLNMDKTLIESDNLKLIQTIKSKTTIGEALAIIQGIQILMENLPEKGMTWTPRNGSRLAHAVAKAVESKTLHSTWSTHPLAEIQSILRSEIRT